MLQFCSNALLCSDVAEILSWYVVRHLVFGGGRMNGLAIFHPQRIALRFFFYKSFSFSPFGDIFLNMG